MRLLNLEKAMRKKQVRNYPQFGNFNNWNKESRYFTRDGSIKIDEFTRDGASDYISQRRLIRALGKWIRRQKKNGWEIYLVTVVFNQFPGDRNRKIEQMFEQIGWVYGRLVTRTTRKHRSPRWAALLPRAIFIIDKPPARLRTRSGKYYNTLPNDGLHVHGLVAAKRQGRIKDSLDKHFNDHMDEYLVGRINEIDVRPITHSGAYTGRYAAKGLKYREFSSDCIRAFPKSLSELTDKAPRQPDPIKDVQSVMNVSDDVARDIIGNQKSFQQLIENRPTIIRNSLPQH